MTALTTHEYRTLVARALGVAVDADTVGPDPRRLFTPSSHRLALDPDVTVVRGARGTGKTYWAKALTDPELREIAAASYMMPRLNRLSVTTGFGQGGSESAPYPGRRAIAKLVRMDGFDPEDFWSTVVLMALGAPQVTGLDGWAERIRWTRDHPEEYEQALRRADRETRESGLTRVLLFDTLDHLHTDRKQADALVAGLFRVALELRLTTGTLRAKIFVRPDMYDSAPRGFADASKLGANAADLFWSGENLYGLLFHQLGNHESPEAAKFRRDTGSWRGEHGRFIAPVDVIADGDRQKEIFVAMAGPYMGTDRRKGLTYTWVPNHLRDSNGEVSPRTWLLALHKAAETTIARYAGQPYPLHYEALREALHDASEARVGELRDDVGWAADAIEQLEGGQVPMEPSVVHAHWRAGGLAGKLRERLAEDGEGSGPRDPDSPDALVDELDALGVMDKRASGAVDLPDVYRLAFNIGRRGGVPRKPAR